MAPSNAGLDQVDEHAATDSLATGATPTTGDRELRDIG